MMNRSFMDEQEDPVPLNIVLSRISDECQELCAFTDRLQHVLSPALVHFRTDRQCHQELQALDNLSQSLAALAVYIETISGVLPQDVKVDVREALAMIPISALQSRLKGTPDLHDSAHPRGELELF